MALKKCKECGNDVSSKAASCPKCGAVIKKKTGCLYYIGAALLIFIVLGVIGSLVNDGTSTDRQIPSPADAGKSARTESVRGAPAQADGLTRPQKNAVRSAKQYLSISGFSRSGLVQQLSSDAGDGYSVADATAAVDSLNVDWNEQAVRSAKQYLSISGFSCKGLIEQLSSSAGDGYTVSQATYGARQAGACE
ncbi:TPA: Ltp family lipoprotein [Aeromonas veronii]